MGRGSGRWIHRGENSVAKVGGVYKGLFSTFAVGGVGSNVGQYCLPPPSIHRVNPWVFLFASST